MPKYAHYNDIYKRTFILSLKMNAPKPKEIFKLGGVEISNSQIQGFQVGADHKNFRIISEAEMLAFIEGLIQWQKKQ